MCVQVLRWWRWGNLSCWSGDKEIGKTTSLTIKTVFVVRHFVYSRNELAIRGCHPCSRLQKPYWNSWNYANLPNSEWLRGKVSSCHKYFLLPTSTSASASVLKHSLKNLSFWPLHFPFFPSQVSGMRPVFKIKLLLCHFKKPLQKSSAHLHSASPPTNIRRPLQFFLD